MIGSALASWVTLHLLRTPWIWLGFPAGVLAWTLAATLGTLGISADSGFLERSHYELAFLGVLLGGAGGVAALASLEPLLERAPALKRLWARALAIATGSALGGVALAAPPYAAGSPLGPGDLIVPGLLGILHLTGLGLVVLAVPSPRTGRSLILLAAAWLAPPLLGGPGTLRSGLARLLDVSRPFAPQVEGLGPQLGAMLPPILAWLLVAALLEAPKSGPANESHHAIRNPR